MSGYEVDHGLPQLSTDTERRRRPDCSTFYANIRQTDDGLNNTPTQTHPTQMSSLHRMGANYYQVLSGEREGVSAPDLVQADGTSIASNEVLQYMIEHLSELADAPPSHRQGVPDDFLANLDRVPKSELQRRAELKKNDTCPICNNAFLDDKYPLVVRLPCHIEHIFDLECIEPWLKLNVTCPLDRKELAKVETEQERVQRIVGRNRQPQQKADDEDEDDADGMYG